jgi:CheY-specific phosphatase CheX
MTIAKSFSAFPAAYGNADPVSGSAAMNLQPQILDSIRSSAANVFATMLGVELGSGEASIEQGTSEANDGVVAFVGVTGAWAGTGMVACSSDMACRICNQMLMTDNSEINEEVLDSFAELANMIVGCVKNDLEGQTGPLGLGIPTVAFGRKFWTKSVGATGWVVVRFSWEGEEGELLVVKISLAPNKELVDGRAREHGSRVEARVLG